MNPMTPDKAACGQDRSGWILCPSKSFPGKYYYFNVLSGECAWSLNDNDKDKLKKGEPIKRADHFHSYPEPSSPPLDLLSPNTSDKKSSASAFNVKPNSVNQNQNVFMQNTPMFGPSCQNYLPSNSYCKTIPEHCAHNTPNPQMMNCHPLWGIQPNHQIILATAYPMQTECFAANAMKRPMFDQNTQTYIPNVQDNFICVQSTETPLSRRFRARYQNEGIIKFNANLPENSEREVIFEKDQEDYIPFQKRKVVIQNAAAFKIPNKSMTKKSETNTNVKSKEIQTESVTMDTDFTKRPCKCVRKLSRKRTISEDYILDDTTEKRNTVKRQQENEDLNKLYFIDTAGNQVNKESQKKYETKDFQTGTETNSKIKKDAQRVTEIEDGNVGIVTEEAKDVSNLSRNDLRLLLLAKRRKSVDLGELCNACKMHKEDGDSKTKKKVTFNLSNLDPAESIPSDTTERSISADMPGPKPPEQEQLFSRAEEQAQRRDVWYVVVDLETLTRDVDFVEKLVTSDAQCRLYLPLSVGSRLLALTRSFCSTRLQVTQARRTARRLAGAAWCVAQNETDSKEVDIIGCCVNLKNNDYHVVLITNSVELNSRADAALVDCYTQEQAARLLTEKQTITFDPQKIKITFQNDDYDDVPKDGNDNIINLKVLITNSVELNSRADAALVDCYTQEQAARLLTEKQTITFDPQKIKITFQNDDYDDVPKDGNDNIINGINEVFKNPDNSVLSNRNENESFENRTPLQKSKMAAAKTKEAFEIAQNYILNIGDSVSADEMSVDSLDANHHDGFELAVGEERDGRVVEGRGTANGDNTSNDRPATATSTVSYECEIETELTNFTTNHSATEARVHERRDEWTCSYVQIMEDVLTKAIQGYSLPDQLPPPWSLHEAAELIARAYRDEVKTRSVAEKLASLLFQFSGDNGVLNKDIKSGDLMRVIGCGVMLVNCLMLHHPEDPDLSAAQTSLAQLLSHIGDPATEPDVTDFDVKLASAAEDTGDEARRTIKRPVEVLDYLRRHFPAWRERVASEPPATPNSPKIFTNWNEGVKIVRTSGRNVDKLKIDNAKNMFVERTPKPFKQKPGDDYNHCEDGNTFGSTVNAQNNVESNAKTSKSNVNIDRNDVNTTKSFVNAQKVIKEFSLIELLEDKYNDVNLGLDDVTESRIESQDTEDDFSNDESLNENKPLKIPSVVQVVTQTNVDSSKSTSVRNIIAGTDNPPETPPRTHSADARCVTEDLTSDSGLGEERAAYSVARIFLWEVKRLFLKIYDFVCAALNSVPASGSARAPELNRRACVLRARLLHLQGILRRIVDRESNEPETMQSLLIRAGACADKRTSRYRQVVVKCAEQAQLLLCSLELVQVLTAKEEEIRAAPATYYNIFEA